MDSTLKAQKRLDSLLGQLKAVETGNPLSRSAAGTSSGSASSYASVPEPAREEERLSGLPVSTAFSCPRSESRRFCALRVESMRCGVGTRREAAYSGASEPR